MARKIRNTGRPIDVSSRLPALGHALTEVPDLIAVFVYGSYGTASQTPLSDIDIALLFADGHVPPAERNMPLIGLVTETLREDDVSVTVLNRAPLAFQHKVLAEGRRLFVLDETALADFVERTVSRYSDFRIDETRFLDEYDRAVVEEYCSGPG